MRGGGLAGVLGFSRGAGIGSALPPTSAMNSKKRTKAARRTRRSHRSRRRGRCALGMIGCLLACLMASSEYNRQVREISAMPTVLLIANNPSVQEMIIRGLGNLDYEVVTASNGEAAIRSFFTVKVDAVVVDTGLVDDLEWLRQRLRSADPGLPGLFLASAR